MQTMIKALLIATILALPAVAFAEDKPASSTPTFASMLESSGITATGFIDMTYSSFSSTGKYINGLNSRVFDVERNSFLLNSVNLTVSKLPSEGFGGLVDLTFGRDADTLASYGTIDQSKGPAAGENQFFDVTQAFINYATGPVTMIAGKFNTLGGAEVIKGANNTNISRSLLFANTPYTHTGARATYKVNDTFSVIGGVNNGWDAVKDTNSEKTVELGVTFAPCKTMSLAVTGYSGEEQVTNYPLSTVSGLRNLLDVVATFNASDKLTFVLNGDYATQENVTLPSGQVGDAAWYGVAGYVNYQFTDQWRTSLRGEYFNDEYGYRTAVAPGKTSGQIQKELTLTAAYFPTKNAELRAEARHDFSDQAVFLDSDGSGTKDQTSIAFEAIYKF